MNFITKTLNRLFKSSNQLELNKTKPLVAKINDLEKNFINYKACLLYTSPSPRD